MKEIRYLPVVLLLLQPVVGSAHNPGHPSPSETTATVVIDASSAEENSSIPRPHAPNAASNPNVPKCHWELREQVRQANKQLVLSKMLKTPAQIEYEDQFLSKLAEMNDLNHQMVIVTIQESAMESMAAADQKVTPAAQESASARVSP